MLSSPILADIASSFGDSVAIGQNDNVPKCRDDARRSTIFHREGGLDGFVMLAVIASAAPIAAIRRS